MIMPHHHDTHFRRVENLIAEWARAIDENRVEDIAALLVPEGRYTVRSRFNADRGLPHALIDTVSAAQLRDRIQSMRIANVYEPHHYRHLISGVQIVGEADGALRVRSNFLITRTQEASGDTCIFATGQCRDLIEMSANTAAFRSRELLLDSRAIETLLVIPL
ncbi:MAG: nuclear transport factor 2 family protein [Pigmentiphaga sp.]|nr:nuclear transport factor 2 family protein [Pigmentiphaga sp.]